MELKEYIITVLTQICEAVEECNKTTSMNVAPKLGANERLVDDKSSSFFVDRHSGTTTKIIDVEFDVSLTTNEVNNTGGKLGIKIVEFGGGVKQGMESTNRVHFSIPVILPSKE